MPTDREIDEKFGQIFMPSSGQRIEKLIASNGRLAHYTTAENALNILTSRSIWLRNANVMNDFSEVRLGHSRLQAYFQDDRKRHRFAQAFDGIDTNVLPNALKMYDQWWANIQMNSFLSCFSQHDASEDSYGRLSMWRAFGKNVSGVAIVIKCPEKYSALPLKVMLRPVMYLDKTDTLDKELQQVITNVEANYTFLNSVDPETVVVALYQMLHLTVVTVKHQGFHEEREWRLCYFPKHSKSDHVTEVTTSINGIPQVVHKLEFKNRPPLITKIEIPELLDRVIIGPSQYAVAIAQSLSNALAEAGVEKPDDKVFISDIPIRT